MKTIVVGDIHGHVGSVEAALNFDGNVVFVGDYLDAFHQSVENQVRCLTLVMDAIEDEPDRVTGLLGNHEMSYLDPTMRCSGYNPETQTYVDHLRDRMLETLKTYHWVDNYLITHAGVDDALLEWKGQGLMEYLENGEHNLIGRIRGGSAQSGGLYWNDFNHEGDPINEVKQVVGHTNPRDVTTHGEEGVRIKYSEDGTGHTWCVDNLNRKAEVLLIEDDLAYPHPLTDAGAEDEHI